MSRIVQINLLFRGIEQLDSLKDQVEFVVRIHKKRTALTQASGRSENLSTTKR
jgi:hypothetical protein